MPGGRPKGIPKTGGRAKGTPNKVTKDQVKAFVESGKDIKDVASVVIKNMKPVDVMLLVMRKALEAGHMPMALAAAEKAAPYCHARLQQTTIDATVRRQATDFTDSELAALASGRGDGPEIDGEAVH